MRIAIIAVIILIGLSGCTSQTSRFIIQNDSKETVDRVIVFKNDDATDLGPIEPGQQKEIQFKSLLENSYSLSYRKDGRDFTVDLCYQGANYPADGVVVIEESTAKLECK